MPCSDGHYYDHERADNLKLRLDETTAILCEVGQCIYSQKPLTPRALKWFRNHCRFDKQEGREWKVEPPAEETCQHSWVDYYPQMFGFGCIKCGVRVDDRDPERMATIQACAHEWVTKKGGNYRGRVRACCKNCGVDEGRWNQMQNGGAI